MNDSSEKLTSDWARVGVMFNVKPSRQTPDLERLILDTARQSASMARLFTMSATWLNVYGDLVAKHRLRRLIRDELELEYHACLGLLLDIAQQGTHPLRYESVLKVLEAGAKKHKPSPLFESQKRYASATRKAKKDASPIAKRWYLWVPTIELKCDALRPAKWIMRHNPTFIQRADFKGDLRSSILASQHFDIGACDSELALSKATGGSRAQVRQALDNLELTGRIARIPDGRRLRVVAQR